jgi:hypothetical protein
LIAAFENDRASSDSLYKNKNIGVSGKIKQVGNNSVTLDAGASSEIICTFDSTSMATLKSGFAVGKAVQIKGIYDTNEGFDANASDEEDMLSDLGKTIKLKTCAINE